MKAFWYTLHEVFMAQKYPVIEIYLFILALALMSLIFFAPDGWLQLQAIQTSTSVLVTDYLSVGGLYATLANVGSVLFLNLILLRVFNVRINGLVFAGLLTIFGFAFFGKNIINSLPIYAGVYIYSVVHKTPMKTLIAILLFSSGLAPMVSYLLFGLSGPAGVLNVLAVGTGLFAGYILPWVSGLVKRIHRGYNLYNVGFSLGFISLAVSVVLRLIGYDLSSAVPVSTGFETELWILSGSVIGSLFMVALIYRFSWIEYLKLIQTTGRSDDYADRFSMGTALLNVSIMGLVSLLVIALLDFPMNGPVIAGIFTVMGFGAFGKHPVNSIPPMVGAYLAVLITPYDFNSIGFVIAILFVTALAPVSGKYGPLAGIVVGFIHLLITPYAYILQGGFDLYNNGFAAGFAALIVVGGIESVKSWHLKRMTYVK